MASNEWYVDPVSGDDATGDGTSDATAWQTIQYAFDNLTQNTTDGDFVNIKDNATITLTADLDWSSIAASVNYSFCVRGYTSTAGDGGYAIIDVDGYAFSTVRHYLRLKNLWLQNTGTAKDAGIYIGIGAHVYDCKFSNYDTGGLSTSRMIRVGSSSSNVVIENCEFFDCNGVLIQGTTTPMSMRGCHFYNSGTKTIYSCVETTSGTPNGYYNNIFNLDSTSDAIRTSSTGTFGMQIINNTFFTSGTGDAIVSSHNNYGAVVENNIFEGWSKAVDFGNGLNRPGSAIRNNHFYDNTTDIDSTTNKTFMIDEGNFKAAGSSVLSKSGANTHANRKTYFTPTGDALGGSVYGLNSIGAVQLTSGGGGGGGRVDPFGGMLA